LGQPKLTTGGRAQRLDDYAKTSNLKRVDFIKIDVDGFECHVLKGGIDTLSKFRPVIIMELAPYTLTERGRSLEELLDILQSLDYRLYYKGKRLLAGIRAMIPDGASLNVIGASCPRKSPIAA
jgi:Methyltransferase FkbM domain